MPYLDKAAFRASCREVVHAALAQRPCVDCGKPAKYFVQDRKVRPKSAFYADYFALSRTRKRLEGWNGLCLYCRRKRTGTGPVKYRRRFREQRRKLIKQLKQAAGRCLLCPETALETFDFHHVDMAQKEGVLGKMNSIRRIREEAAKCVVLCANCHRKVHSGTLMLS